MLSPDQRSALTTTMVAIIIPSAIATTDTTSNSACGRCSLRRKVCPLLVTRTAGAQGAVFAGLLLAEVRAMEKEVFRLHVRK
ncbi:hypothetical protein BGW80DRAFT_1270833 [Lactifluus volemus]|nr:hypothetical protein BGW80DRAFT_1270833 [Lactifluus volemus]